MRILLVAAALAYSVAAWPAHLLRRAHVHTEFHRYHDTLNDNDQTDPIDVSWLELPQYQYIAPTAADSRSSCPFVSACANHGLIPRNGRDIHFETVFRCARLGGFSHTLFRTTRRSLAQIAHDKRQADKKAKAPNPHAKDRISLHETSISGPIEHDLSLTRKDQDHRQPDQALVIDSTADRALLKGMLELGAKKRGCNVKVTDTWLDNPATGPVNKDCYLDEDDIGEWIAVRTKQEEQWHKALGRPIKFGPKALVTGAGEAVFLLYLMGREGEISLEHARVFLRFQKFPKGWVPPPVMHFPEFMARMTHMSDTYIKYRKHKDDQHSILAGMKDWDEQKAISMLISSDEHPGVCEGVDCDISD